MWRFEIVPELGNDFNHEGPRTGTTWANGNLAVEKPHADPQ